MLTGSAAREGAALLVCMAMPMARPAPPRHPSGAELRGTKRASLSQPRMAPGPRTGRRWGGASFLSSLTGQFSCRDGGE